MNEHLYRSRDDRMIAGVAGGLAEIWDADPSLIRIVWALLIFLTGGIALLVYVVMAIVVPEEDEFRPAAPSPATPPPPTPSTAPASATQAVGAPSAIAEPAPAAEGPAGWIDPTSTAAPIAAAPIAAASSAAPVAPPATPRETRHAARAARRAARRERRGNTSAGIVIGAVLILLGGLFLLQEWLPAFDFDLFWPLILVGLGVVLLLVGFTRDSGNGGTTA